MSKLFKKLKVGLKDAIAHGQDKPNLRSETIVLPEPPVVYKPTEIKRIREYNKYSQDIFAIVLNISIKTVQSWESGVRASSHAALRLLETIDKGIYSPEIYKRNL
jgi:putative transcriptional regulator